jgi:sporulation protein YlmC with PRC-barrel domain
MNRFPHIRTAAATSALALAMLAGTAASVSAQDTRRDTANSPTSTSYDRNQPTGNRDNREHNRNTTTGHNQPGDNWSNDSARRNQGQGMEPGQMSQGVLCYFSDLEGRDVKAATGDETIASVNDILIDRYSGRIAGVVLSRGGVMGIGNTLSLVRPSDLMMRKGEEALRTNLTAQAIENAGEFDRDLWRAGYDADRDASNRSWWDDVGNTLGWRDDGIYDNGGYNNQYRDQNRTDTRYQNDSGYRDDTRYQNNDNNNDRNRADDHDRDNNQSRTNDPYRNDDRARSDRPGYDSNSNRNIVNRNRMTNDPDDVTRLAQGQQETFRGRVLDVDRSGERVRVSVQTDNGTREVDLGPVWYVSSSRALPMRGEQIEIVARAPNDSNRGTQPVWSAMSVRSDRGQTVRLRDEHSYQGAWNNPSQASSMNTVTGRFVLASDLVGEEVRFSSNAVGEIQDLVIDHENKRVRMLAIDPDENLLGWGDTIRLVPFRSAVLTTAGGVDIDATRDMIGRAPVAPDNAADIGDTVRYDRDFGYNRPLNDGWSDRNMNRDGAYNNRNSTGYGQGNDGYDGRTTGHDNDNRYNNDRSNTRRNDRAQDSSAPAGPTGSNYDRTRREHARDDRGNMNRNDSSRASNQNARDAASKTPVILTGRIVRVDTIDGPNSKERVKALVISDGNSERRVIVSKESDYSSEAMKKSRDADNVVVRATTMYKNGDDWLVVQSIEDKDGAVLFRADPVYANVQSD